MRLTLRTLLAYLDRILEEDDARELGQKIQESEIATQLVDRIHHVLAQRKSSAIGPDAEGIGQDANGVAEYLDNTLPADRVPEFERVCLDSDQQLGEVAACHQILTLVLGEPAEIPTSLKQRIYRLDQARFSQGPQDDAGSEPHDVHDTMTSSAVTPTGAPSPASRPEGLNEHQRIDNPVVSKQPASAEQATVKPAPAAAPAPVKLARDEDEHWTEAPDYLKRPRRSRWKPIALTVLIAFSLAMAALRGMGPFDETHPLAGSLGLAKSTSSEVESLPDSGQPGDSDAADTSQSADAATSDAPNMPALPDPADVPAARLDGTDDSSDVPDSDSVSLEPGADVSQDVGDDQVDDDTPDGMDASASEGILGLDEESTAVGPFAADDASNLQPPTLPDDDVELDLAVEDDATPGEVPFEDESSDLSVPGIDRIASSNADQPSGVAEPAIIDPLRPDDTTTNRPPLDLNDPDGGLGAAAGTPPVPPVPTPETVDVGRFLDPQQVLLRYIGDTGLWYRMPVGTRLQAGETLMSLPTFRPPVVLASGMQVTLINATRLQVLEATADGTPRFDLEFGRLAVATFAQAGTTFGISWGGDRSAILTLADMNTTLAVELEHVHLPGQDPRTDEIHQLLNVFVTSGNAEWQAEEGPPIQLTAGQRLTLLDRFPAQLHDVPEMPTWIDGRDVRPRDPLAAQKLAERLVEDRPITLVLQETANDRRYELRNLAVNSLAYFDQFGPLLVALNDPNLRSYWSSQYETMVDVIGLSAETATQLHDAIIQRHGADDGELFYEMLTGYSPSELNEGGATQLVDNLDHESCDFRIVASEMLKSITGEPSLYRPGATERDPQRRSATVRWRRMLDAGEIVYGEIPDVIARLQQAVGQTNP